MKHDTILYISDHATSSDSVIVELEEMGYEVVSTESSTQGIALLYISIQLLPSCSITGRKTEPGLNWRKACGRFAPAFRSSC